MFTLFGMQFVLMKYKICLLSPETQLLYCIESLHPLGLHMMDTVLRVVKTYFVYSKVAYAADEHCLLICDMNTALFTFYVSSLFMYLNLLL